MRIAFVWTEFSGYMADCWRKLATCTGVELRVFVEMHKKGDVAFDPEQIMQGVNYQWLYTEEISKVKQRQVADEIAEFGPDALFVCGWSRPLPFYVARSAQLKDIPKILCCDMPWEWRIRKFAARFLLRRHLRHFQKIFVPGYRAAMYGRWLGFGENDVARGEYGIDVERFNCEEREGQRKGFVFVGRLSAEKGIATLATAYCQYRAQGGDWPLEVYGLGAETGLLEGVDGVTLHGFVQPDMIPSIYAQAGAFVLASSWDPWPLVLLESCAAGLPIICTENCWDRYELIRANGHIVPVGDANAMANAMLRVKELHGEEGRALAANYSCEKWSKRVIGLVREIKEAK